VGRRIMAIRIEDKVGAILDYNVKSKRIRFLGYGIYEGNFVPHQAIGYLRDILVSNNATCPRIKLDTGKYVYGCECWWGSVDIIDKELEKARNDGYEVVNVDIDEVRKE
jgi:hypothetical protein